MLTAHLFLNIPQLSDLTNADTADLATLVILWARKKNLFDIKKVTQTILELVN